MNSQRRSVIFVSSVQKELAAERRAVKNYVEGDPLLRQFFDVFLFEDLPASGRRADQVYLAEVERCDLYLGLFGNEYGFEDAQGVSPTEREFDAATGAGKERIVLLKGTKDAARHPKMKALVRKAGEQLIRRRFASVPELTSALYASLVEYLGRRGLIQNQSFEEQTATGVTEADIDPEAVAAFIRRSRAERRFALPERASISEALTHLHLLSNGVPTHAALMLFGRNPQQFLPNVEVRCMHFHGTEIQRPAPYYQIFKGTLFNQVDRAVDFVLAVLNRSVGTRAQSTQAPVTYEVPPEVVREAIVNAVAHRDYASGGVVQVSVFADRVEVSNPGTLPPPMKPEDLRQPHGSVARNHRVCEAMFLARYIEKFGTGTLMMIRESVGHSLPEPDFVQRGAEFVVTLWRDWLTESVLSELGLNPRQVQAVTLVKTAGKITNAVYQQATAASRPTAIRDLADLVTKGVFARHGAGRSAFYTLAVKRLKNDSIDSARRAAGIDSQTTQTAHAPDKKTKSQRKTPGKHDKNTTNTTSRKRESKKTRTKHK
jgi:ATP-dependent DNA helicase RecG